MYLILTRDELYELLMDDTNIVRKSLKEILKQEEEFKKKLEEQKIFDKIMKDLDGSATRVREAAINHPKASKEHIDKALNDPDWWVRYLAIKHPNVSKEHIDKALDDSDDWVREAAILHPKATKEHLDKALDDSDDWVREVAKQRLEKETKND